MRGRKGYIVILAVMVLIPFAELIFSNVGTLFDTRLRVDIANQLGLTDQQEIVRLTILSIFDLIAGGGALLMLIAALRPERLALFKPGQWTALIGYAGYGIYQIVAGMTVIAPTFRGVIFTGVFYIGLGIIGFIIGNDLKRA